MIKMILMTGLLLLSTCVYAESPTDKGVYSLGGSISYTDVHYDGGTEYNTFSFNPSVRYFIFDNVAVGGSLGYGKTSGDSDSSTSYGIGPNIRFYLPYEKINPFIEAGYSYLRNKYKPPFTSKITSNEYTIGFGLDLFISRNVSIEPTINYSWHEERFRIFDYDTETLYFGIGVNLFIF